MKFNLASQVDLAAVKAKVVNGSYFAESRQWYNELYHRPLAERSFFIVITCFSFLTIFVSWLVYSSLHPLHRTVPYIIESADLVGDTPVISPLRYYPSEDLNVAVARFLIKNYVEVREGYKYDVNLLEQQFNRIRSTSGDREFNTYQRQVSPQNPASPFNKYGREIVREIYVSDISLNMESEPQTARIRYVSVLRKGLEQQTNRWQANIVFTFPPLIVDQETNKVLQLDKQAHAFVENSEVAFAVQEYVTQELGQE